MRADQRTVTVGSCTSRPEAEFKRHVLVDAGIDTFLAADDAGGLHPEMGFAYCGAYRLLVPEDRVDEAADLLASFEPHGTDGPEDDGAPPGLGTRSGAEVRTRRSTTFWFAVLTAAVLLAAAIANAVNVLTAA